MDFSFADFSVRIDWRHRPRLRDKSLPVRRFGPLPQTARKKLDRASAAQWAAGADALAMAQLLKQVLQ